MKHLTYWDLYTYSMQEGTRFYPQVGKSRFFQSRVCIFFLCMFTLGAPIPKNMHIQNLFMIVFNRIL